MAESKEELKSLLMKVKEESEKADFKLSVNLEPIIQNEVRKRKINIISNAYVWNLEEWY